MPKFIVKCHGYYNGLEVSDFLCVVAGNEHEARVAAIEEYEANGAIDVTVENEVHYCEDRASDFETYADNLD